MLTKILQLFNHKCVKNSFWIIGEKIIQVIISFIITMISARYLGPANYGILNYGTSLTTFFLAITKLGLDSIAVNEMLNNDKENGKILGTSLVLRLISSFISIIFIYICVIILKPGDKIILITSILQSISLIFQALSFIDYWFQYKLESKYVSVSKIIAYFIMSIYKVYLLVADYSVEWFALSNTLDYLLICLFLFYFYNRKDGPKLQIDMSIGKKLISKSYHFILSSLMVVIYTQIDKIMIGSLINEENLGYYSAALTIYSAGIFIPEAIITSARPTIYSAQKTDYKLYIKRLKQTFSIVFWLCTGVAIIVTIFSKHILMILYGKEYLTAKIPLIMLIWATPFSQLGTARGIWIVGESLNKYTKKYLLWGALINILLNSIFIPEFGINGAAFATLITEIVTCFISPLFYKKTKKFTKLALEGILCKFE